MLWWLELELDDEMDEALVTHAARAAHGESLGVFADGTLVIEFDDVGSLLRTVDRIREAGVQFEYKIKSEWHKSKRLPTARPGARKSARS